MFYNIEKFFEVAGFAFIIAVISIPLMHLLNLYIEKLESSEIDNLFYNLYILLNKGILSIILYFNMFNPAWYIIIGISLFYIRNAEKNEKKYAEEEARKEREYQERLKIEEDYLRD